MATATGDRYERALALYEGGDFQACRELVLEELSERPKDAALLRLAGRASTELDLDDAASYLQQAVEVEPDNADAWRDLAEAHLYRNRLTDAMEAIRQAVELRPEESEGLVDLGLSAYAAGRHDDAIAELNKAVDASRGTWRRGAR